MSTSKGRPFRRRGQPVRFSESLDDMSVDPSTHVDPSVSVDASVSTDVPSACR